MGKKNIEIIPAILVKSFEEAEKRIRKVKDYAGWVQIDIMDGIFVGNKTWPYIKGKINDLKKLSVQKGPAIDCKIEIHLMVEKPEEIINNCLEVADRIIVHYESEISNLNKLIEKVHKKGKQISLAINPKTPIEAIKPFLKNIDAILCMTVDPGLSGQKFKDEVLVKIKDLRSIWPDGNIEVDGGINPQTAEKAIKAGANLICVGAYIFGPSPLAKGDKVRNKDIKQAIGNLKMAYPRP